MAGKHAVARSAVFAMRDSGLSTFLYAEVGTELNGSGLTILSVLARLGRDPWAEAASWVTLPRALVVDRLAQCVARMPLSEQALREARTTAERLARLLPSASESTSLGEGGRKRAVTDWLPLALILVAALIGTTANILLAPAPPEPATSPIPLASSVR